MPLAPETGWPVAVAAVDWRVPAHLSANVAVPTTSGWQRPSGCEAAPLKHHFPAQVRRQEHGEAI